ncbi:MFS transporter [Novosphingobium pokkalii]|uniref:MFS transporter n=1 Tax=Novosphingobium pokkalii TaxID=1770194 RepID=A0ABV7V1Q6_9SPHN|nr:MFS transporter [Novosphingobium pokkalii]GHC83381.1 MFS transporter [Novosphingobium pokkalii]
MSPSVEWSRRGIAVMWLCFVLNMVDGVNVFALTYVAPALQQQFGVGASAFSIVFSAGLVGMAAGGLGVAPLADRFGRRPIVLMALALMAGAMIASALATGIWTLALARVIVGLGIGTVLASITALSAGFAPDRMRHVATGVPQAGYPIGATIAGFVVAPLLPVHGWQAVFVGAGLVSLALIPICWFALPEAPDRAVARDMPARARASLGTALGGARRRNTALMWLCTINGFMALYFIASWITKLAIQAGLAPGDAIVASAIYNGGAFVGTIALSFLATRWDLRWLMLAMLCGASVLFLVFGAVAMPLWVLLVVCFLIGITLQGGVNCNYPLAASLYPAEVRATGIGWAMGVGRAGALLGPVIGGAAMGAGLPLVAVFAIFCVPMLLTGLCAVAIRLG